MTDDSPKQTPAGGVADGGSFENKLDALRSAPDEHETVVSLEIGGGLPGERYELNLAMSNRGAMSCSMSCDLTERKADTQDLSVEPMEVVDTLTAIDPEALMADPGRQGGFPPCSLVGRLELRIDDQRLVRYFMADEGQAKTIGYEPPAYLNRATDKLYRLAEKRLGLSNIRP